MKLGEPYRGELLVAGDIVMHRALGECQIHENDGESIKFKDSMTSHEHNYDYKSFRARVARIDSCRPDRNRIIRAMKVHALTECKKELEEILGRWHDRLGILGCVSAKGAGDVSKRFSDEINKAKKGDLILWDEPRNEIKNLGKVKVE